MLIVSTRNVQSYNAMTNPYSKYMASEWKGHHHRPMVNFLAHDYRWWAACSSIKAVKSSVWEMDNKVVKQRFAWWTRHFKEVDSGWAAFFEFGRSVHWSLIPPEFGGSFHSKNTNRQFIETVHKMVANWHKGSDMPRDRFQSSTPTTMTGEQAYKHLYCKGHIFRINFKPIQVDYVSFYWRTDSLLSLSFWPAVHERSLQ